MTNITGFLARAWTRRLWILPPLIVGVAAIALAPMIKSKPAQVAPVERAAKVRAITVTPLDVVARATGYGAVQPGRSWEAVAEVAGQVEWISQDLKNGRSVSQGTPLLGIEDVNYRLALTQATAQLKAATAKVATTRESLAIAQKDLDILTADFERKKGLLAKGAVSKTTLEAAERQMLNGQTQVQNLTNALELSLAERDVAAAAQASAELDLARTRLIAPFDVRITTVNIGEAQYANKGQTLFTADGLDVAEVEAQFPIGILRPLISAANQRATLPLDPQDGAMGLDAVVRLTTATHAVSWPARIVRTSGVIDPQTQSIGVVVAIDNPEIQAAPGVRPRLLRNTFVEVELIAPPRERALAIPRSALHGDTVYVVTDDNRLERRTVQTAFTQDAFAVVAQGLKAGERIVTSDLISAIDGMLLDPVDDKKAKRNLVVGATGQEPQK